MRDWGRVGRRTTPFTVRVVCDGCGVEMSAPTVPDVCPLCDGTLEAAAVSNVTTLPVAQPTLDLGGAA